MNNSNNNFFNNGSNANNLNNSLLSNFNVQQPPETLTPVNPSNISNNPTNSVETLSQNVNSNTSTVKNPFTTSNLTDTQTLENLIDPAFLMPNSAIKENMADITLESEPLETLSTTLTMPIPPIMMDSKEIIEFNPQSEEISVQSQPINSYKTNQSLNNLQSNLNMNPLNPIPHSETTMSDITVELEHKNQEPLKTPSQEENFDGELIKAYIGKNHHKFTKKFNFAAFFFSISYILYRKMYLIGLLCLIIFNLIIYNLPPSVNENYLFLLIGLAINLIIGIILAFSINKIYLSFVKRKVHKIKKKNADKSNYELIAICAKKGGTNLGTVFSIFMLQIFFVFLLALPMIISAIITSFGNELQMIFPTINNFNLNDFINDNTIVNNSPNTFNNSFSYNTSVIIDEKFNIMVPTNFQEGFMHNTYQLDYEYDTQKGLFATCSASLVQLNDYTNAYDLAIQMYNYHSSQNPTPIENNKVNNIDWYTFSYNGSFGTTYYYLMNQNDDVYLFEYEIEEDASIDCIEYKDQIIESITLK